MKGLTAQGRVVAYLLSREDFRASRVEVLSVMRDLEATTVHRAMAELTVNGVMFNPNASKVALAESATEALVFSMHDVALTECKSWRAIACPECFVRKYANCKSRNGFVLARPHKARTDAASGKVSRFLPRHGGKLEAIRGAATREQRKETKRKERRGLKVAQQVLSIRPAKPPGKG